MPVVDFEAFGSKAILSFLGNPQDLSAEDQTDSPLLELLKHSESKISSSTFLSS